MTKEENKRNKSKQLIDDILNEIIDSGISVYKFAKITMYCKKLQEVLEIKNE